MFKRQATRRAFTIVELLVTLSIFGLLLITILPSLSRYGRNNGLSLAAQSVREALADTQSMAVSGDSTVCANIPSTQAIGNYAFFVGALTPINAGTGAGGKYICGSGSDPVALQPNQYAILARAIYPGDTTYSTIGIVKIGTLDTPAQFNPPLVGSNSKIALLSYNAPNGAFYYDAATMSAANVTPGIGDKIISKATTYTTQSSAAGQYAVIGLINPTEQSVIVVFVNNTTGQVTSTGIAPNGFQ